MHCAALPSRAAPGVQLGTVIGCCAACARTPNVVPCWAGGSTITGVADLATAVAVAVLALAGDEPASPADPPPPGLDTVCRTVCTATWAAACACCCTGAGAGVGTGAGTGAGTAMASVPLA